MIDYQKQHRHRDQDEKYAPKIQGKVRDLPDRAAFRGDGRRNNPISRLHWTKGTEDLGAGYDRARHTLHRPDDRLREICGSRRYPATARSAVEYTIRG